MKKQTTTQITVLSVVMLIGSLAANAERPSLESLESLTMELANASNESAAPAVVPVHNAPAESVNTAELAPVARTMAPVATDRMVPAAAELDMAEGNAANQPQSLSELRKQEAKQATSSNVAGGSLNGWLAIGLVLMVMGAVAMWLKRKSKPTGLPSAEDITPLAVTRLWGKHSIGLVKVSGRILVVGLGESGMNLLTELEETELPSPVPSASASDEERSEFTASLMQRFQGMKKNGAGETFASILGGSAAPQAGASHVSQLKLSPLTRPTQPGPAEELVGLSEERAAIRRRLDALRQRNLRVA